MIKYEDECVGCREIGLPCLGSGCGKTNVPHYYCDKCGDEEVLYYYDGQEICLNCIRDSLTKVIAVPYSEF